MIKDLRGLREADPEGLDQRGGRRQRKAADLARDIVGTLSAMANADGGELVIGNGIRR